MRSAAAPALLAAVTALAACGAGPDARRPETVRSADVLASEEGEAAWYGARFQGRRTASGEPFDADALTAAHRTLPFGTRCRVTNAQNGRQVVVRITDRGPRSLNRVIDLSRAAAEALNFVRAGHARVRIEVLR